MNIFRMIGDGSHLVAILCLLIKIFKSKSCAGISGKSQLLFLIVFCARYIDLFTTFISVYNVSMKFIYITITAATLYGIYFKYEHTNELLLDTVRIEYLIVPAAILAGFVNHENSFMEILWTFSIYLEALAVIPQIFFVKKTGEAESLTIHYIFALGAYRAFYLLNWIYRYNTEYYYDLITICSGIVQTILYFALVYYLYSTSTANKLLIEGIPVQENENLKNTFLLISCALGAGCNLDDLSTIEREFNEENSDIIVKFTSKKSRDQFYQSYFIKKTLCLEDISIKSSELIVISEYLTPKNSKILKNARLLKERNLIQMAYSSNGFIYIIPLGQITTVRIKNLQDLYTFDPELFWLDGSKINLNGGKTRSMIRSNSLPDLLDSKVEVKKMEDVFVV